MTRIEDDFDWLLSGTRISEWENWRTAHREEKNWLRGKSSRSKKKRKEEKEDQKNCTGKLCSFSRLPLFSLPSSKFDYMCSLFYSLFYPWDQFGLGKGINISPAHWNRSVSARSSKWKDQNLKVTVKVLKKWFRIFIIHNFITIHPTCTWWTNQTSIKQHSSSVTWHVTQKLSMKIHRPTSAKPMD